MRRQSNLTKQNSYTNKDEIKYECPICKDVEFIINPETRSVQYCRCRDFKRYKRILEYSGISKEFQNKTFENYIPKFPILKNAREMAINYVKDFEEIRKTKNNSIALFGQVGSGKTHLSIAIANELMKNFVGVVYMQYKEAILRLKQCVLDRENYEREISRYKGCPVLLIDDLFKGETTTADRNIMFEIINYRYFIGLPMIISSELLTEQLLYIDEAIGSRIIEMCRGRIIELVGEELNFRLA